MSKSVQALRAQSASRNASPSRQNFSDKEFDRHKQKNGYGTPPAIWVDWMELEGPLPDGCEVAESKVVRVEPEKTINPDNEKEIAEIEDAYKRFTQWQVGVDKAAATPENKAKIAELSKKEPAITHPIHFYRFAHLLNGAPDPGDFGFRDSGKAAAANPNWDRAQLAYHKHYAGLPHRDRGTWLKLAHGTGRVIVSPEKLPPGNYVMRVRVGAAKGTPASRRFIQIGHPQRQVPRNRGLDGSAISSHQVSGTIENPETIEIPLEVGADTPREFAVQEKQPNNGNLKALWDAHNKWKKENGYGHPPAIWIDWVELEGPLNAPPNGGSNAAKLKCMPMQKLVVGAGSREATTTPKRSWRPASDRKALHEQEAKFRIRTFEEQGPTFRPRRSAHENGSFLTISPANKEEFIALPSGAALGLAKDESRGRTIANPGEYKLRNSALGAVAGHAR